MNIHEYQAKLILQKYGIPVSSFTLISSLEDLNEILKEQNLQKTVLKIQIHAGGRGKAGGIKIAQNQSEIIRFAKQLMGMQIINNQTGPQGIIVEKLLLTPIIQIKREFYLSAVIDRQNARATLIASPQGGMEIEEIAIKTPENILTVPLTDQGSIRNYNLLRVLKFLGLKDSQGKQGEDIIRNLAKAFIDTDASLIEINPLAETVNGELIAVDAKFSIDDNALFRHPEIAAFYDPLQLSIEEREAKAFDLAYVGLNGWIGCMVNGAGLAMATMDIIHLYKGEPANFLDVGGGATKEKIAAGFKIILSDPKVRAILINIFGGIMDCQTLAEGILEGAAEIKASLPIVIRMEGTNVDQGKKLLAESNLNIITAETLDEAAQKVVKAARL